MALIDKAKDVAADVATKAAQTAGPAIDKAKDVAGDVASKAAQTAGPAWDRTKATAQTVGHVVSETIDEIKGKVSGGNDRP